jgi:transcriptional regulator of met regulon
VAESREQGDSAAETRAVPDRAAKQRQAIRRALVAHGYLLFTGRRNPLPIRKKKVTWITDRAQLLRTFHDEVPEPAQQVLELLGVEGTAYGLT